MYRPCAIQFHKILEWKGCVIEFTVWIPNFERSFLVFLFWQSDPSWPDISWNCLDAVKWNQSDFWNFWTDKNFLSIRNRVFLTVVNNEDFIILILKINDWFGQSTYTVFTQSRFEIDAGFLIGSYSGQSLTLIVTPSLFKRLFLLF